MKGVKGIKERYWPLVRRYIFDGLIVVGFLGSILEFALTEPGGDSNKPDQPYWIVIPAFAVMTLPLLARRRFPFAGPALIFLLGAVISFYDAYLVIFSFVAFISIVASAFLLGMVRETLQSRIGLVIAIAAVGIVVHNDPRGAVADFFFVSLVAGIAWLAGFALSGKLEEAREAKEKAARLEQEREEQARLAVADERARIARELHDVVGHAVSVMTVQASGVRRLLKPEQEREREALLVVEQTGRQALAEMRRLVGVLRRPEEGPALAPQPSLEHLDKLVAQVREAGLPVALRVEGTPSEVPRGIDLTAYRLVQEGLTNALKHADAGRADVLVRYGEGEIELVVQDNGTGNPNSDGGGHGLVGMRERVSVYGGELEAGPRAEGGFELRARLPLA